jgi:hypothetical protein
VNAQIASAADRYRWLRLVAVLVGTLALAAVVGAYVDWMWWLAYQGFLLTLLAMATIVVGGLVAVLGRRTTRRVGLAVLAVGVGLLLGQNLGPSREALIQTAGGTMTVSLESPIVASVSGPAECMNVASGTEFAVLGTPNLDLGGPERVVDSVSIDTGDRWEASRTGPRKDGVSLEISATYRAIPDDGVPVMVFMTANEASTVEPTFSNEGGSIRFAGLVPLVREGYTAGDPIDYSGTIEWTCGDATEG